MSIKSKIRDFFSQWVTIPQNRTQSLRLLLRALALMVLLGPLGLAVLYLAVSFEWLGPVPATTELLEIRNHSSSEVYSADSVLLGKYYIENRSPATLEEMSPYLVEALVATEDARFYRHSGVDFRALLRVLYRSILLQDESGGGGSTISQQLAKNLFGRRSYRVGSILINKLREMIVASRLEAVYSKDDILALYLNTVPFGGNVFGVEVAARQYFGKTALELKREEAATLIGMLKATTTYHPVFEPESSVQRRNVVLRQMAREGYLPGPEADSLAQLPLRTSYRQEGHHDGPAPYFREHLRLELEDWLQSAEKPGGGSWNLYTDGLRIYTSIDSRLQTYAEAAVSRHLKELQEAFDRHWSKRKLLDDATLRRLIRKSRRYQSLKGRGLNEEEILATFEEPVSMTIFSWEGERKVEMSPRDSIAYYFALLNAGFLAAEPQTGWVRAWVGGINHHYFQYDHVLARRQVGSTFKPVVYAAALRAGVQPCEYFTNEQILYPQYEDWQPRNADGVYEGAYSMAGALSESVNTVAAQLLDRAGIEQVQELGRELGIRGKIPAVASIALGTPELSLFDMTQAYATFANDGIRRPLRYLLRIEDRNGQVIADFRDLPPGQRALSREEARVMTALLRGVVDGGTAARLRYHYGLEGELAGKTGTTQSHADGWFMGYTPTLVAGAWVGGAYPQVRFRSLSTGQGARTALPIVGLFLRDVQRSRDFWLWRGQAFEPLPDSLQQALACEPYLDAHPDSTYSIFSIDQLEDVFRIFKKKDKRDKEAKERAKAKAEEEKEDRPFRIRIFPKKKEQ